MDKKIALVHDQLHEFGGAERVLVALTEIFPNAPIYTAFHNPKNLGVHSKHFEKSNIIPSWAQKIPFFPSIYSPLRFLAPFIWKSFDFSKFDLVISSSGWYMCKGVKTGLKTINICYLHHPPRYLYGYETAVEWQKYALVKIYANIVNYFLRIWDYESSQKVDYFIANSIETKTRIKKFYRRYADVIYPPVNIPINIKRSNKKRNYYVTTARLTKAKHIDILIHAANKLHLQLKIIGSGREEEYLKSISGPTIEFLDHVEDSEFRNIYSNAKGFLFASVDEEFGIAPIEAMGYGVPVVAYSSGGLKETVQNGKNGFLYDKLEIRSLMGAINKFEKLSDPEHSLMRKAARKSAEKYSFQNFKENLLKFVKVHN